MNLRQLDKKHFGRQGEPEDVVVGNGITLSCLADAKTAIGHAQAE